MKQREIIKLYLNSRYPEWVKEGLIRGRNTDFGFIGFRGDRNVREMISNGEVEAKFEGKYRVVRYRKPETPKQVYNIVGSREEKTLEI